jgi:hypothetical protein
MLSIILSLIITIAILFFGINYILKKNIEGYGVYCGRYNMKQYYPKLGELNCTQDPNCEWNSKLKYCTVNTPIIPSVDSEYRS